MKKLLKEYHLNSDMQYFEMITDSFINGQFSQAIELFEAMPKMIRITFLKSATVGNWDSGISKSNLAHLFESI